MCNDVKLGRVSRLHRMLHSYIPEVGALREKVVLSRRDAAASWEETQAFDKVLLHSLAK